MILCHADHKIGGGFMSRLFGTDGIRGVANEDLTCDLALRAGQAAAQVLKEAGNHKPLFLIGKDTRISSDMFQAALTAGICSVGGDVQLLGVVPTPAVAYLTKKLGADAGIMISASHNSYEHNGIKLLNSEGYKLPDEIEDEIEARIKSGVVLKTYDEIGVANISDVALQQYIDYVVGSIQSDLKGLRVLVDCANGSAAVTAKNIFRRFKADAEILYDLPNGVNINYNCGSTHLNSLSKMVVAGGYDVGIAFDGDADRCLAINEKGEIIDGDQIMAVCGVHLKKAGKLPKNTIVATVMSNLGFHMYAKENGINVITADVGDRYVLEEMKKGDYMLGGEQSGHLIFLDKATTGDGQLTAMQYLEILAVSGLKASELGVGIKQYPQVLKNVKVRPDLKHRLAQDEAVNEATLEAKEILGSEGRILVRPSGTEPLVRVMVEGFDDGAVYKACDIIVAAIERVSDL
jgi:phosphoglucosamine mutase